MEKSFKKKGSNLSTPKNRSNTTNTTTKFNNTKSTGRFSIIGRPPASRSRSAVTETRRHGSKPIIQKINRRSNSNTVPPSSSTWTQRPTVVAKKTEIDRVVTPAPGISQTENNSNSYNLQILKSDNKSSESSSISNEDVEVDNTLKIIEEPNLESLDPPDQQQHFVHNLLRLDSNSSHFQNSTSQSVSVFPSIRSIVPNNSPMSGSSRIHVKTKTQSNIIKKVRRPGRYKVKVMEDPNTSKPVAPKVDQKSPYRTDDFIDVDGKLKIEGKAFDTYITHEQYRLLKDFYVPGLIVSRVASRSKSRVRRQTTEVTTSEVSKIGRNKYIGSSTPLPLLKPMELITRNNVRSFPNVSTTTISHVTTAISHVSTAISHFTTTTFPNVSTTTLVDIEQQTTTPYVIEQAVQTEIYDNRRTVAFDLENTIIKSYQPESTVDFLIITNPSNDSLASVMGIHGSSTADFDNELDIDSSSVLTNDLDEQILWDRKVTTALQMVAAILSAQLATTQTMETQLIRNVLDILKPEEHQELLDFVSTVGNDDSNSEEDQEIDNGKVDKTRQSLYRLMEVYRSAYNYMMIHIEATEIYDMNFPEGRAMKAIDLFDCDNIFYRNIKSSSAAVVLQEVEKSIQETVVQTEEKQKDQKHLQIGPKIQALEGHHHNKSLPITFLRYIPEVNPGHFKIKVRANQDQLTQHIRLNDFSYSIKYGVNGVSTILSASRIKDTITPISTGNLLLMQNQHASLASSRIVSSKYFMNQVVTQLTSLGKRFITGKYSKLLGEKIITIKPKLYHQLREINVYSGILFQLSSIFVLSCKKMLGSMRHMVRIEGRTWTIDESIVVDIPPESVTIIGQPMKTEYPDSHSEYTVPTEGVLPADAVLYLLASAFEDIDEILVTGSTSLQALNESGVKVRQKYYKTIVRFIEATQQLERGRELDFGAVLMGFVIDTMMLHELNGRSIEPVLDYKQQTRIMQNYYQLQHFLQELTKLSKKVCLISSFASSKTMFNLNRFRHAQESTFGCWSIMTKFREPRQRRKRKKEALAIVDKPAFQDISVEGNSLKQDSMRFAQMLVAISNESSISACVF